MRKSELSDLAVTYLRQGIISAIASIERALKSEIDRAKLSETARDYLDLTDRDQVEAISQLKEFARKLR